MDYKKISVAFVATALALTSFLAPLSTPAQSSSAADIVLVLPFENVSNHPEYNWVGESFADSLSALLNKPGLIVITGDERVVAYQRLRLPPTGFSSPAAPILLGFRFRAKLIEVAREGIKVSGRRRALLGRRTSYAVSENRARL